MSATSVPMSESTSRPTTARWCALSPGQAWISGERERTVSSSPSQPCKRNTQTSLLG
ncbi:Uncharacterised protein [Mycobacteroides abscessus subsp. abscessus]|nr:Uncharacterised protein [Mycobacteroides abscessus subsp. abscessus]